ncbi:MAG: hypothetical protein PVF50_04105 [Gammaproteobacteria bacterium]|jgi:hypothetical protein
MTIRFVAAISSTAAAFVITSATGHHAAIELDMDVIDEYDGIIRRRCRID